MIVRNFLILRNTLLRVSSPNEIFFVKKKYWQDTRLFRNLVVYDFVFEELISTLPVDHEWIGVLILVFSPCSIPLFFGMMNEVRLHHGAFHLLFVSSASIISTHLFNEMSEETSTGISPIGRSSVCLMYVETTHMENFDFGENLPHQTFCRLHISLYLEYESFTFIKHDKVTV